jgi:serine/threonine-protein kinase
VSRAEVDNDYELLKRLAAGGMGEVFVARKTGTGDFEKHVALKLLLPHLTSSAESVKRFYDEARLAARMRHPNIVEIFDVGEAEGRPFIAMQLIEGVSLAQHLANLTGQGLAAPLPIVRAIALGVCEALAYAHTLKDPFGTPLKLVHRDVTPSNILLSFTGAIQLTDFGIARIGDTGTRSGHLQGKAAYVAPEQIALDSRLDARADLYSAAVSLYELLTGRNPFRRTTQDETLTAILEGSPPALRAFRPDASAAMEAALRKAMSRQPRDRFDDAVSFRKAFIDGPVASAPEIADHVRAVSGRTAMRPVDEPSFQTKSQVLRVTHNALGRFPSSPRLAQPPRPTRTLWLMAVATVLATLAGSGLTLGLWRRATPPSAPTQKGVTQPTETVPESSAPVLHPPESFQEPPGVTGTPSRTVPEPASLVRRLPELNLQPPTRARDEVKPKAKPAASRPQPAPLRIGYLAADAVPWADVLVDGVAVDRTPFSRYPLKAGRHEVTFRAPDGRSEVRTVTVVEGEVSSIRVDFKRP